VKVAQHPHINDPGAEGYVAFASLYARTFLLSLTMTVAILVITIPRIYGRVWNLGWSLIVIAVGSATTGTSLNGPDTTMRNLSPLMRSLLNGGYGKAMRLLAVEYGPAFYGGIVVGIGGGIILTMLVQHHRSSSVSRDPVRPAKPWIGGTIFVIVLIGALAYGASLRW